MLISNYIFVVLITIENFINNILSYLLLITVCLHGRASHSVSRSDAFPISDIHDALDHLRGSRYFATVDLLSGYRQLGMTDRAKERSAFCTRRGLFQFTRMPFGLAGAPASFCRLMSQVFKDHLWMICLSYLDDSDDSLCKNSSGTVGTLMNHFYRLREVGSKVKPSKCLLFKRDIEFVSSCISPRNRPRAGQAQSYSRLADTTLLAQ